MQSAWKLAKFPQVMVGSVAASEMEEGTGSMVHEPSAPMASATRSCS